MNIYIGFTLSPKRYAMRRLRVVLNYFSSFTNDDLITFLPSSNMMVRLALFPSAISVIVPSPKTLCLTLSPMSKFSIYLSSFFMAKFNNKNKLLSRVICSAVHSNMNRDTDIYHSPAFVGLFYLSGILFWCGIILLGKFIRLIYLWIWMKINTVWNLKRY